MFRGVSVCCRAPNTHTPHSSPGTAPCPVGSRARRPAPGSRHLRPGRTCPVRGTARCPVPGRWTP
ncbi:hypothetical protein LK08_06490 [Streptomyces sp. MUSC 125]|nr:hypothetical protein LK08_06490 [Streptomyces sp. MUSC 125]